MSTSFEHTQSVGEAVVAPAAAATSSDYYRVLFRQIWPQPKNALRPATLGVTSCANGEGVTTITVQLARVAAEFSQQVLVFDASGTQSSVYQLGGLRGAKGLFDYFEGADLTECIQPAKVPNVSVLGTGTTASRSRSSFDSARVSQVLREVQSKNRLILVDLPNATELSTCFSLAAMLEGVLLVVEAERIRNQVVQRTKDQLVQANAQLLGVVFNKRRNHVPDWLYQRL